MKKQILTGFAAVALLGTVATTTLASDVEDAIEYRQDAFNLIKWHFGPMAAMVKGKIDYDKEDFARRAELVAALAKMPQEGFIEGSDKGDTDAKPEIWENKDQFDKGMQMMVDNAAALAAAAQTGDMANIKPAFGQLGKTCKGCHDNFRKD